MRSGGRAALTQSAGDRKIRFAYHGCIEYPSTPIRITVLQSKYRYTAMVVTSKIPDAVLRLDDYPKVL
jgi:hypothetical protein